MRIFQFAKWWWDKNDEFTRTATCFVLFCAIPCAIATIWFGKNAVLAIFAGIITVIAGWALYGLFCWLRMMWERFNDEQPTEEVAIVRKLKGIPTPSMKEEIYYD
jgi:hypothetical protein